MRQRLVDLLIERASDLDLVFITGDVGFRLLEPLRDALGERFINAGVAEQNMIGVAAGMSAKGLETWVYSIAPFIYARPFEQVRNDLAFHGLPVKLVGNGGGYGYGVHGPSHHAIEDYGVLLTMPNLSAYVPVFDSDLPAVVNRASIANSPVYIRLGRDERPHGYESPPYAPWRQLISGGGPVLAVAGPLAGTYLAGLQTLSPANRPRLWAISELPIAQNPPPRDFLDQIESCGMVVAVEEHVCQGGFGAGLLVHLADIGVTVKTYRHLHARRHNYGQYGSQNHLRRLSGLDPASVIATTTDC